MRQMSRIWQARAPRKAGTLHALLDCSSLTQEKASTKMEERARIHCANRTRYLKVARSKPCTPAVQTHVVHHLDTRPTSLTPPPKPTIPHVDSYAAPRKIAQHKTSTPISTTCTTTRKCPKNGLSHYQHFFAKTSKLFLNCLKIARFLLNYNFINYTL